MGDKSQISTIALASQYTSLLSVWLGSTLALIAADSLGIVLEKHIRDNHIAYISAFLFIFCGLYTLYETLF